MRITLFLLLLCSTAWGQSYRLTNQNGSQLRLQAGTQLVVSGTMDNRGNASRIQNNGNLHLKGDFVQQQNASYQGDGWLLLTGSSTQTLTGDAPLALPQLRLQNPAGAQLGQALQATGTVQLISGDLDLNGQNLDLGPTGTLQEDRPNNHLVIDRTASSPTQTGGYIRATQRPTNETLTEIAGTGIALSRAGTVTVFRYHYSDTPTIRKNYRIEGQANNAQLRITFADQELGSLTNSSSLTILRYNGTNWTPQGGDWTTGQVSKSGIDDFTDRTWTVGIGNLPSVSVRLMPAELPEDGEEQTFTFVFERSFVGAEDLTIHFSVSGTATLNDDFFVVRGADTFTATSGTITIPAGSTQQTLLLQIKSDNIVEADETITLTLQNPGE
ncbi:MAG: hypothetical protein ACFCUI_02655 [Bernardetiaceae bacterium]